MISTREWVLVGVAVAGLLVDFGLLVWMMRPSERLHRKKMRWLSAALIEQMVREQAALPRVKDSG